MGNILKGKSFLEKLNHFTEILKKGGSKPEKIHRMKTELLYMYVNKSPEQHWEIVQGIAKKISFMGNQEVRDIEKFVSQNKNQ